MCYRFLARAGSFVSRCMYVSCGPANLTAMSQRYDQVMEQMTDDRLFYPRFLH